MAQDIIDGFFSAIPKQFQSCFQFYPEYTDIGNSEMTKMALNKMVGFHHVDVVSGIISYKVIPEIVPIFEKRNKIGFFFDMGEYLPPMYPLPIDLFFNSLKMWQLEYALGYWSQKTIKGKGAILTSVYDSGYHLHSSFIQGAASAGAEEMDLHILPYHPELRSITPLLPPFFEKIEKAKVEYLHAIFCGNEALEFFDAYKKSSLCGKIPLTVSPHMSSSEITTKINNLEMSFYSASGWNYSSVSNENQTFKQKFEFSTGRKASLFGVLGYEAGLAFYQALPDLQKEDNEKVIKLLKDNSFLGPRGKCNFSLATKENKPVVEIEKILLQPGESRKIIIEQDFAMDYSHSAFEQIHTESISGWKNPYLCV